MKTTYEILNNRTIASNIHEMRLAGETAGIQPGQFVEIQLPGLYLRRPLSVADAKEGVLTIIYKTVGEGTQRMAGMEAGTRLDMMTGLGNGYNIRKAGERPLLVGGGVGVPPLYYLARMLRTEGKDIRVILGFNTAAEVFYEEEFAALGCEVVVTTADGSRGMKGFATAALDGTHSYYYACGPLPMLRALIAAAGTNGEVSMEERMGCGYGACMGCTIQTRNGNKRVCKDGPVFAAGEIK